MGHGITWLNFLPGFHSVEMFLQRFGRGVLGHPAEAQHVVAALLVSLLMGLVTLVVRRDMARAGENAVVPQAGVSLRNLLEIALEALYNQSRQLIGPDCARYFPVLATFGLFIFISNCLGLIPGFIPPTDNWNTTFACGLLVFFYYNYHGLRTHGIGHIVHLANPVGQWWGWFLAPLMFPIELISHCARPFSLGVRLAANMVGDHAVVMGFLGLVPILVPLPFMVLGLMVAAVQTLVFVLLSMVYIGMATAGGHDAQSSDGH
jgi:F-type H+-transporting ATPase subunit a